MHSAVPFPTAGTTFKQLGGYPSFRYPSHQLLQAQLESPCLPQENAPKSWPGWLVLCACRVHCIHLPTAPMLVARLVSLLIREGKQHLAMPTEP